MKVSTVIILLLVGVLALAGVGVWYWLASDDGDVLGAKTVLEVDLTRGFAEDNVPDSFGLTLLSNRPRLREVVSAFRWAAEDDQVLGIVAKVGGSAGGLGSLQELRDAVLAFRASGKKTIAFAETFGEFGAGNGGYYLASAFDEIFLQPSGDVGLTGLRYEVPFVAGAFEKLGVETQLDRRKEFKNAVNTYTEKEFTAAHSEAMQDLVDSQFEQIVGGVAEARSMEAADVRSLFDRGPFFGQEALDAKLVDRLAYRDEVYAAAEEEWGEDVAYSDLVDYRGGSFFAGADTVALVYGVGAIVRGSSRYDPMAGSAYLGADTVAEAFRDAVDDKSVRAILFRVNSPGGSYVASDTVWRETLKAREAGKPVIVSIGDVAGSGGYFVAMGANRIIAQPGSITGSIGVYGGKLVSRDLWDKLGVTFDSVSSSENAEMWSGVEGFDARGWERMSASLDRIYNDFVSKVADGRGLTIEEVEQVARGRIWTGERALERGLVDELGGYPEAYAAIREELDLEEDAPLRLKIFPRPKHSWEVFLDQLSGLGADTRTRTLFGVVARLGSIWRQLGLPLDSVGVLEMPFVPVPN